MSNGMANGIPVALQTADFESRGAVAEAVQSLQDWYAGGESIDDIQLALDVSAAVAEQVEPFANPSIQSVQMGRQGKESDVEYVPGLSSWSIGYALLEMHLARSDDAALGIELDHFNGLNGAVSGIGLDVAQAMIGAPRFGSDAQTMQTLLGLTEGLAVLA